MSQAKSLIDESYGANSSQNEGMSTLSSPLTGMPDYYDG
jgi:hypothetical protein